MIGRKHYVISVLAILFVGIVLTCAAAQQPKVRQHETVMGNAAPPVSAQERAMVEAWQRASAPGPEHAKLAEMAGVWNCSIMVWREPADPKAEPVETKVIANREMSLGGRVLRETWTGVRMGQPFIMERMMGYDNGKKRYWLTSTDNMSTGLEVTWGKLNASGQIEFLGEFEDPGSGRTPIRQVYTMPAPGKQVVESYQVLKGKEYRFIKMTCDKGK